MGPSVAPSVAVSYVGDPSQQCGCSAQESSRAGVAERAKGTGAAKLAAKYGVSTAYIYMIKELS